MQVSLHHFMDANGKVVKGQTIAVFKHSSGVTQGLLTSESKITIRGLAAP